MYFFKKNLQKPYQKRTHPFIIASSEGEKEYFTKSSSKIAELIIFNYFTA